MENYVGINANVYLLTVKCINLWASKNSGEVRSHMKSSGLFDLRDNLIIQILKFEFKSDDFIDILNGV